MLTTTLKIIRSGLEADPSLTSADRTRLMGLLRNGGTLQTKPEMVASDTTPRVLRRAEVARRLAVSLRTVDSLPVKKVKLPGRSRACGFLESDINAMLAVKE